MRCRIPARGTGNSKLHALVACASAVKRDGTSRRRAAFLDRDGVINVDRGYVYRREDFEFVPGVLKGARELSELGYLLVVATNQSGIGRGLYSEAISIL